MPAEILRPNGVGDETDWSSVQGVAAHWDAVNDTSPDDSTTYIAQTVNATVNDSFALVDTALTTEVIDSIDMFHRGNFGAGAGFQEVGGVRLSGSNTMAAARTSPGDIAYHDYTESALARPGGGSWAVSDLNGLQVRIQAIRAGFNNGRCTQVYVTVNYSAAPVGASEGLVNAGVVNRGLVNAGRVN